MTTPMPTLAGLERLAGPEGCTSYGPGRTLAHLVAP